MFINVYLFIVIIGAIISLSKSTKTCDFKTEEIDFTIDFKGIVKKRPTTFGSLFEYLFTNDLYCTGEWTMISNNSNDTYRLKYYGDIRNGLPHGNGLNTMISHNYYIDSNIQTKYSYIGNWKNGYKEGFGSQTIIFIDDNNNNNNNNFLITRQEGIFLKNDIIEGIEYSYLIEKNTCSEYKGTFLYNRPHGYGSIYHNNGTVFEGEFNNGILIKITKTTHDNPYNCLEKEIQRNLAF